jgi:hypothetical protein
MRVVLKECAWEALGDDLVLVRDPREALTLANQDGQVEALLGELSKGPVTAGELTHALCARGFNVTEGEVSEGLTGLDSLGLLERPDERSLGDARVVRPARPVTSGVRPPAAWLAGLGAGGRGRRIEHRSMSCRIRGRRDDPGRPRQRGATQLRPPIPVPPS